MILLPKCVQLQLLDIKMISPEAKKEKEEKGQTGAKKAQLHPKAVYWPGKGSRLGE